MKYHESYGELSVAVYNAIKKYNVSPADYMEMEHLSQDEILSTILENSPKGYFDSYLAFYSRL